MSRDFFWSALYTLWCIGVVALFVIGGTYAWSPFADGRRAAPHAAGYYGPMHK